METTENGKSDRMVGTATATKEVVIDKIQINNPLICQFVKMRQREMQPMSKYKDQRKIVAIHLL